MFREYQKNYKKRGISLWEETTENSGIHVSIIQNRDMSYIYEGECLGM